MKIGSGTEGGNQAAQLAGQGYLVVALLKAADHYPFKLNKETGKYDIPHPYHHGHLAIVLPGRTKDGYPYVISGSIVADGQSDGSKSVRGVWRGIDAPNVHITGRRTNTLLLFRVLTENRAPAYPSARQACRKSSA